MENSILQPCEEMKCSSNEKIAPQVVGILMLKGTLFFLKISHIFYPYHA